MSLLYDANGDRLTLPAVVPTGAVSIGVWFFPTDDTARQSLWHHLANDIQLTFRGDLAGDPFDCFRGGSVAYGTAAAPAANFAHYGLNKFLSLMFRSSAGNPATIRIGDETNPPALPSSFTTQTNLNTPTTSSAQIYVGSNSNTARWIRGRVGAFWWWNGYELTDSEVDAWWLDPWGYRPERGTTFTAPYDWGRLGINGTTDVPSEMGLGAGTITGLSSADRQPSRVFPGGWPLLLPKRLMAMQPLLVR